MDYLNIMEKLKSGMTDIVLEMWKCIVRGM